MRLKSRSLRLRLILGAAVWITAALVLAGAAIGYLFISSVERGARADLAATLSRLVALIDPEAKSATPMLKGTLPDARYDTPISGIYWQVTDLASRQSSRSRSLWDQVLQIGPVVEGGRFSTAEGPDGRSLLALTVTTRFPTRAGERRYQVVVAQDRSILDEAIIRFGGELTVALLILGGVLILAAVLQVQLGLAPLAKLRRDIENIRRGSVFSVDVAYPLEVVPLVSEVNELLAQQRTSVEFARARAADLAHGLKTPLAVLGTVADDLEDAGDKRSADLILALLHEMRDRIDYQMRLARLRQRTRMHAFSASMSDVVRRAVVVIRKTREGERLDWLLEIADSLDVDIDENDLVELVGVVLENAAKWAFSLVHVEVQKGGAAVKLSIRDDGPGIDASDLGSLGVRGRRLDETKAGTGLGLAIAREIVALNHGTIAFGRSNQGGLAVTICLPVVAS